MCPLHFGRESAGDLFHLYRYQGLSKVMGKEHGFFMVFQHVSKLHEQVEHSPQKNEHLSLKAKQQHNFTVTSWSHSSIQKLSRDVVRHKSCSKIEFLNQNKAAFFCLSRPTKQSPFFRLLEGLECQNYKSNFYWTLF